MTISMYFMVKDSLIISIFQPPPVVVTILNENRSLILGTMMFVNAIAIFNASIRSLLPGFIALILSVGLGVAGFGYYSRLSLALCLTNIFIFHIRCVFGRE